MDITIAIKCDRSGRVLQRVIDDTEIDTYKNQQAARSEALKSITDLVKEIEPDELPDLVCIYRGEIRSLGTVIPEFNDQAVKRLLDQLFHTSDPSERAKKARVTKANKEASGGNGNGQGTVELPVVSDASLETQTANVPT